MAVDADGCVTVWDQGAVDLIGHRCEEIVGRSVEAIVPPEYRDRHCGSGLAFDRLGDHDLEGVPGTWQLFAARS